MNVDHPFWTYGAGRRVCPGSHLGDSELFLAFARIVYTFSVEAGEGAVIDTTKMKVQFTAAPDEYMMRLEPRWSSEKMAELGI